MKRFTISFFLVIVLLIKTQHVLKLLNGKPVEAKGLKWSYLHRVHAFNGFSELFGGTEEDHLCR